MKSVPCNCIIVLSQYLLEPPFSAVTAPSILGYPFDKLCLEDDVSSSSVRKVESISEHHFLNLAADPGLTLGLTGYS